MTDQDLLVNLYDLPFIDDGASALEAKGIKIKKALPPDKKEILEFIRNEFSDGWADEAERAMFNTPASCYIAVRDKKVVGFSCYDATALGYFGPIGVDSKLRGFGIGSVLMRRSLLAMREKGYGYIIINAGPVDYYIKTLNARVIGDHPGVYSNMICN